MSTVKKRVLVVDDDPELVASVRAALLTRGYDVSVAGDGAEALAQIERNRPDLMLLDLVMPRRSGFTVLDRMVRGAIRADSRHHDDGHRRTKASGMRGPPRRLRLPVEALRDRGPARRSRHDAGGLRP